MPSHRPLEHLYAITTQDGTVLAIRADKNAAYLTAANVARNHAKGIEVITDGDIIHTHHEEVALRVQEVEDVDLRTD